MQDVDWIERIKSDPDKTLTTIYDDFRPEAIRWIVSEFNLQKEDAEEIFQTSLVLLYDNVVTGKLTALTSHIKTYLFGIIKYKIIHHNRAKGKIAGFNALDLLAENTVEDYSEISAEELEMAQISLIKLGDPCKTLLELSFYQQLKMDEITHLMGYKNSDTTKNQKYKCLKRLQKLFFELIDVN